MVSPLQEMIESIAKLVAPGVTTQQLDDMAGFLCKNANVKPAFLGYKLPNSTADGFPANICVSINDEVIHGIPSLRTIELGDVVKIDMGIEKDGEFDDGATTVLCGTWNEKEQRLEDTSATARKLVKATKEALEAGVAQAKAGNTTHDIAKAVEEVAKKYDLHVIHGYGGHGIGEQLHMEPHIPNELDGTPSKPLEAGKRVAIEPMLATNHGFTYIAKDGWTVKLRNGGLAAHFEQTVTVR